jgi:tRNA threonylcarbamoyladenosine biosynthesis protein TsaB
VPSDLRHAERILPMIESLLLSAKIKPNDLEAIAFGCGPGSFIGLRLATAVAQSLAFAQDLPVIPVSSLQALAQHAFQKTGAKKIVAGWDARMLAIYWGLFEERNGFMESLKPEALSKPEEIQVSTDFLAVGNAWQAYEDNLIADFQAIRASEEFYPNAISLLEIASEKFLRGEGISPLNAEPIYLRNDVAKKSAR